MNSSEYWMEVKTTAENIAIDAMDEKDNDREDAEELINDSLLHETVDGHEWIIYYAYNLDVIKHSDNAEYMADNFGGEEMAQAVTDGGVEKMHMVMAFWAFYADIQDELTKALDDIEEGLEEVA